MLSTKNSEFFTSVIEQSLTPISDVENAKKLNTSLSQQVSKPLNDLLLEELQLKNKLCDSVHTSRRADFSLMLAMLSDDVREFSQFSLPEKQHSEEKENNNKSLRAFFELGESQPLGLGAFSQIASFNQASLVREGYMDTVRLKNTLSPKPLAFRNNKQFICHDVLSNTSLVCQTKHKRLIEEAQEAYIKESEPKSGQYKRNDVLPVLNKSKRIEAINWLKAIQKQRI
jgi:hypothetical protein